MASYTFIPSSLTGGHDIQNASNAYADTSSTNKADVTLMSQYGSDAYLGGFSISISSSEIASSVTVKVKGAYSSETNSCAVTLMSASDGVALSNTITLTSTATVYTFTLTESAQTVASYFDTLCIRFETTGYASYGYVYGAEVIVETEARSGRNKIVLGNTVLIDLTGDTATASDVAVGKTFHLASGEQATGTLSPSPTKVTIDTTTASTTLRELTCSGLTKEPSWFVLIFYASNGGNTGRSKRIMHALYDGITLATWNVSSTEGAVNRYTDRCSFSYSSGTLTLTITNSTNYPYFGQGTWELYYL